jgi:uncharacterized protein YihD (DUF1040 family)
MKESLQKIYEESNLLKKLVNLEKDMLIYYLEFLKLKCL